MYGFSKLLLLLLLLLLLSSVMVIIPFLLFDRTARISFYRVSFALHSPSTMRCVGAFVP